MSSKDLTKGNILICTLLFSLPIFIGNLLQQVYNLTDTWVVGKYLENGISAIGSCSGIYDLLIAFANGMTSGFAIVIARAFGEKNEEKRKKSIWYTILLTVSVTLILTILTCSLMKPILWALKTPEDIFDMSYTYIMVIIAGMITTMLYNMFTAMMRSAGNSMTALICLVASVLLNVGLDFLFVAGFHMGIFGCALATVAAQGLAAVFCLIFILVKMPELHVSLKDWKWDKGLFRETLLTGLSMGFMLSIVYIGTLIQQGAINDFGEDIISAHSLARKMESLFMAPLSTMGTAAATFAGQNYGAGKVYRIKKSLLYNSLLGAVWSLISFIAIYAGGRGMIIALGSLNGDEEAILTPALLHMRINVPFYTILGVLVIMRTTMQAVGYKIVPSATAFIELFIKILIAFVFTGLWGYMAVIWGEPIIWCVYAVALWLTFAVTKQGKTILKSKRTESDY